mgnify:CR=1 FL=1
MKTHHSSLIRGVLFAAICLFVTGQTVLAAEQEAVDYRLTQWKTRHFHDAKKAELHLTTLKRLGCEVKQDAHNGHIDVKYRCPNWRRMLLKTHSAAHRWEKWLTSAGFEAKHSH